MTYLSILLFGAVPGYAQYWMETEPGYVLTPVDPDFATLAAPQHPQVGQAQEAAGVVFDALFWVLPGTSSCYRQEWDEETESMRYREYRLTPVPEQPDTDVDLVPYVVDGLPLMIGVGQPDTLDAEWAPAQVVSFAVEADGSLTPLDYWELGAQYCNGIYMLDLLGDGSLCLVLPWATGAAGGGGVDLLWISPAGGFSFFGATREEAMLWSQTGYVNLRDYDNDGAWEIETAYPLMFSAAGYSYKELLYFDRESWSWLGGAERFPEFYAPQDAFYRILFHTARELEKDPAKYLSTEPGWEGSYGFQLDGEWYSLDPFMNLDTGEFDPTWLDYWEEEVGE